MRNNLSTYRIISFAEEDNYINGLRFCLTKQQYLKIIDYFRNQGKWTQYYYCEVNEYFLTHFEIIDVLNLKCPFWVDDAIKYFFTGFSATEMTEAAYKKNSRLFIFQSYYKKNQEKSHSYVCDIEQFMELDASSLLNNRFLNNDYLKNCEDNHRRFDCRNFDYKLEEILIQDLFVTIGEHNNAYELEYSKGFWEDDESTIKNLPL